MTAQRETDDPMRAARADRAMLDLGFVRRGGRTVIDRRRFAWPFVVTRGFYVDQDLPDRLSVIVQTGSGAVHGEDVLAQRLVLGAGTAVRLTNQGATSVHLARQGACAVERAALAVAPGASLEYAPEPPNLFPGAALRQTVELDCALQGSALVFGGFTMHDPAGTARCFRELENSFCLRRSGGEPVVIERMHLLRPDEAVFRGHRAFGSAMLIAPSATDLDELQRALTEVLGGIAGLYGAASPLPGAAGIGVRVVAPELRMIRFAFETIAAIYRRAVRRSREESAVRALDPCARG